MRTTLNDLLGDLTRRLLFVVLFLLCSILSTTLYACDSDQDCGDGGTCVKREKRARGVCFGGNFNENAEPISPPHQPRPPREPVPTTGVPTTTGNDAPIYGEEGYVEPIATKRTIDRLHLPAAGANACMTSSECGDGTECVYRDPMLGHGECEVKQ